MMKRIFRLLVVGVVLVVAFHSCEKEQTFDESLLIGRWKSGTVYFRYKPDYTGYTWDTDDDVTEAEAQPFTWELNKSQLTQIHIMQIGGSIPKVYTVTELTENTLKYKDSYKSYSFTRFSY